MMIGVLVPRSGLYPSIGFDIVDGMKAGLSEIGMDDAVVSVENIGLGNNSMVIHAACEKLLMNGAEVVAGYVNPATAEALNSLFRAAGKVFIALDAGYHLPIDQGPLSNVITLSLQGAFCCYMVTKTIKDASSGTFVYTASFYDAGYRSGLAYAAGVHDNGGNIIYNHITHLKKENFTLEPLCEFLDSHPSDAILASFCGDMSTDFFKHANEKKLYGKAAIYCSPFMAEETLLDSMSYPGHDAYSVVPWSRELSNKENETFKAAMLKKGRQANVMSLLGWEAALVTSVTGSAKMQGLGETELNSPRGKVRCGTSVRVSEAPVYDGKIMEGNEGGSRFSPVGDLGTSAEAERVRWREIILEASKVQMDTWHNAYLCIE
jgi:branched-chain amino acid transport system substrate-binding protein